MTTAARPLNMIPVARPCFGQEEEQAVLEALRSGWVSQGPKVAEFEKKFAEYVGAKYAIAVSSCTTALHLAMVVAGIKQDDEVLCPSYSFIATANCVRYVSAQPVFVDIDPITYNLDPNRIEEAITPRTRAILVVHQIGLPAAMDEINAIAARKGLLVIEDAACAVGSEYRGQRIGRPHSPLACFSFHPRKILSTGEGGMLTTNDEQAATRLRTLRQHAMTVSDLARHSSSKVVIESYAEVGFNYRMTDLQAAIGLVQLQRLDGFIARRRMLAERYTRELAKLGWLLPPQVPAECRHNFQSYSARVAPGAPVSRDELMQKLLDRGISTRRGIMSSHREPPYAGGNWDARLPETTRATDESIILPLFHQMSEEDQDYVVESIREVAANAGH
jgi:perosamine synthetase